MYLNIFLYFLFILRYKSNESEINQLNDYYTALSRLFEKAKSEECKRKIQNNFNEYWNAFIFEEPFPFEKTEFHSQCSQSKNTGLPGFRYLDDPKSTKPKSSNITRRNDKKIDPNSLSILYVILVHKDSSFIYKLIESLYESQHTFVIHVDSKSSETFQELSDLLSNVSNIFLLPPIYQNSIVWGGYSIVNATLVAIEFGFSLNRVFDYVIDLSGSTYPIQTKESIRKFLSNDPNLIYNSVKPRESKPPPEAWHHYVECDGALHRIGRLTMPRGISSHVGSQWFAMPRHVAEWILKDPLPLSYREYATHVVVADEHYFATMFTHSPFCKDLINFDVNFLQFADWEVGNPVKCLQPDPKRCGRSPATLNNLYIPSIMMSDALFARKFDSSDEESMNLFGEIESIRRQKEQDEKNEIKNELEDSRSEPLLIIIITDEISNHPITLSQNEKYFCLQVSPKNAEEIRVVPCDLDDKTQYFSQEKCVSIDANIHNASKYENCPSEFHQFSDSLIPRYPNIIHTSINSNKSEEDLQVYCRYRALIEERTNEKNISLCLDIRGQQINSDATIIGYQCSGSWNQYFRWSKDGRLSATQPYIVGKIRKNVNTTDLKNSTVCLKVSPPNKPKSPSVIKTASCSCNCSIPILNENNNQNKDINSFSSSTSCQQSFRLFYPQNLPKGMTIKQGLFIPKNQTNGSSSQQSAQLNQQFRVENSKQQQHYNDNNIENDINDKQKHSIERNNNQNDNHDNLHKKRLNNNNHNNKDEL